MQQLKDEGIILKSIKLSESDQIITVLTKNYGIIKSVVKGARKSKNGTGGVNQVFNRIELLWTLNKNPEKDLDILNQSILIESFGEFLALDYERFLAANQIAETTLKLLPHPRETATQHYLLVIRALKMLIKPLPNGITPNLVSVSFVLRSLAISGWELDDSIWLNLKNSELYIELFEALTKGDWQAVAKNAANSLEVVDLLIKTVAKQAVSILESRFRTFN